MTATLSQIRAAVADTLSPLNTAWNITAQFKPSPNPPQIDMMPGPTRYDTAMAGGAHDMSLIIRATVQPADVEDSAQNALDVLASPTGGGSLKALLESNRNLGGTIAALRVTDASEYKIYPQAGSDLVGIEFNVTVLP